MKSQSKNPATLHHRNEEHHVFFDELLHRFERVLAGDEKLASDEQHDPMEVVSLASAAMVQWYSSAFAPGSEGGAKVGKDEMGQLIRILAAFAAREDVDFSGVNSFRSFQEAFQQHMEDGIATTPEAKALMNEVLALKAPPKKGPLKDFFTGSVLDAAQLLFDGVRHATAPDSLGGFAVSGREAEALVQMAKRLPDAMQTVIKEEWHKGLMAYPEVANDAGRRVLLLYTEQGT
jgi:hypothetical protein